MMVELSKENESSLDKLFKQYEKVFKNERKGNKPVVASKRQALISQATNDLHSKILENYEKIKGNYLLKVKNEIDIEIGLLMNLRYKPQGIVA